MINPVIKIVPMPGPQGTGGSGNGSVGPEGPAGQDGAGYEAILVDGSQLPSTPGNFTIALDGPLPSSWVAGMGIRLTTYNISNGSPISGIYAEGYIQQIFNEDNHFVFQSLTSRGGPWGIGDKQVMSMTVAGTPGSDGIDANTGNFVFNANNVSTNENMEIFVNGVPGNITLSAYEGVAIQASAGFGLSSNQISTNNLKIQNAGSIYEDSSIVIDANSGYGVVLTSDTDAYITSRGGNVVLQADGSIYKNNANAGNEIVTQNVINNFIGDPSIDGSTGNTIADRINAVGGGSGTGDITFSGIKVIGAGTAAGDASGNGTIELVPDIDLQTDQYLIIDPTSPNHIHIRAGGTQDASTADLFLGGERNKIQISDQYNQVQISTNQGPTTNEYRNLNTEFSTQFIISSDTPVDYGYTVNVNGTPYIVDSVNDDTPEVGLRTLTASGAQFDPNQWYEFTYQPDGTNNWTFTPSGLLLGPAQGFLNVTGFVTPESYDLALNASASVVLNGNNGEFLNDPNVANNQIATVGDVANYSPVETSFAVNGGTTATQPTFNGDPLFSGTYLKVGPQVHFQIQVDMDNITSFGTGQYYVDLPFDAKYGYQFKEGCLHDISTSNQFAIGGHVAAGTNRLYLTYTGSNGQDEMFTHSSPVGLNVADNFHIAGTYIS